MVMVEQFANSPPSALRDFACALDGADADVLAGHGRTLADIASGVERMKRDKIARTLPNPLGRRPSALGRPFADVSSAPADVSARAALLGLPFARSLRIGRLRCAGRLRRGLGLAVLGGNVLSGGVPAPDCKCESKKHEEWCSE
jgi:hypothetical protein